MNTVERIRRLENKVVAVCVLGCPHAKFVIGKGFQCDQDRSQCHSKKVRRCLDKIKKLEAEAEEKLARKEAKRGDAS